MKKHILILALFLISIKVSFSQNIEADRISERILILNEGYFSSVAINTNKGIVLIDTRQPLEKMKEFKEIIKREFNTDTFCYIINTHGCPEHILGNPAFPNTPAIMSSDFFNRQKIYLEQKTAIDSMENVCLHGEQDSLNQPEFCDKIEQSKNWRKYCIAALSIKPDITYHKKMDLHFDGLTILIMQTGLIHGYSSFIYIPEERFLHTSTLGKHWAPLKFTIPAYLDEVDFMTYQIRALKEVLTYTDSLKYVVPCHNNFYSGNELKQILGYYIQMYDMAEVNHAAQKDFSAFETQFKLEEHFSDLELFKELDDKGMKQHTENIKWLWDYFERNFK